MIARLFARLLGCYAGAAHPAPVVSRPLGGRPETAGAGSEPCSSSPAPASAADPRAAFVHALVSHRRTPYAKGAMGKVYDTRHAMLRAELGR